MSRRQINTPLLLGALTGALLAVATMAHADQNDINSLLGADDIGTGHASQPAATGPQTTPGASAQAERWVTSGDPVGALSVITVHPLPGDGCQNVLFDMRPSQRVRHSAAAGATLEVGLDDVCLFGIRNDSDDRAIAVRLGEELRTVAIGIDSRLQSGLTIGPGHEVLTPIRPLSLTEVSFSVEVVWDDLIDSGEAKPTLFDVRMASDQTNGS